MLALRVALKIKNSYINMITFIQGEVITLLLKGFYVKLKRCKVKNLCAQVKSHDPSLVVHLSR